MLRLRPPQGQIPLYDASGMLVAWVAEEWCEAHADHLRVIRTRRARRIVRCYLRETDDVLTQWLEATLRRSNYGHGVLQQLPSGHLCWTLAGVRGSR